MRFSSFCLIFIAVLPCLPSVQALEAETAAKAGVPRREVLSEEPAVADLDRAREMLNDWEKDAGETARRVMRICYWTPQDREPLPEHRARLTRVMRHIQDFYLREMNAWGFAGRTIQLEQETDGLLHLHLVRGTLKAADCSEADREDGKEIRRDCMEVLRQGGIDGDKETVVIFCNLSEWDAATRSMSHHSPYYASGTSQGGTAWQVDSPLLDSALLAVKDQHLQDGQYGRISLGKYNSIFIGGVCHELGHALGLPHCKECAAARLQRGTALMGSGNRTYGNELRGEGRGSFLSLPHALKLAAHPQFSGSAREIATPLKAAFEGWELQPEAAGLRASAVLKASLPVHAVLAYADPAGGDDYDSEIAAAVPDEQGRFTLLLPRVEKKRDTMASLHFVAVAVNGAATAGAWSSQGFTINARVDANGAYDISKAMTELEFGQYWPAFRQGVLNQKGLEKLRPEVRALFKRLSRADSAKGKPSPADAPGNLHELALSDAAPIKAATGWGGVHYDRNAEGRVLAGPEGLLAHGLYAHADSAYEYELGGQWQSLSGSACILQQGYGAVEASILGDGRELWKSGTLKSGETKAFRVDVSGVSKLVLLMKGKNGINGAWSAWAEPMLGRK